MRERRSGAGFSPGAMALPPGGARGLGPAPGHVRRQRQPGPGPGPAPARSTHPTSCRRRTRVCSRERGCAARMATEPSAGPERAGRETSRERRKEGREGGKEGGRQGAAASRGGRAAMGGEGRQRRDSSSAGPERREQLRRCPRHGAGQERTRRGRASRTARSGDRWGQAAAPGTLQACWQLTLKTRHPRALHSSSASSPTPHSSWREERALQDH